MENHQDTISLKPLEKRRYARTPVFSSATIGFGSGWRRENVAVSVKNVSSTGMSIEIPAGLTLSLQDTLEVTWLVPPALHPDAPAKPVRLRGNVMRLTASTQGATICGLRFDDLVVEQLQHLRARRGRFLSLIGSGLILILICLLKSRNIISFWYQPVFQVYSLLAAAYVLSRVALLVRYRTPKDRGYLTAATVIIAVKNEEACIAKTVEHCLTSRYPQDLLELLVIDDGSTDGTWAELQRLVVQYPQLRIFQFEKNQGKRHAMALGAQKAKGNILIFLDSDSLVEPEAIYRIVQPFAEKRVGAVAGHTLVIVEEDNFISKMEAVRYFISQRVMKAAESVFGAVTCCPGPLSAYRRDLVMAVLPQWLHQKFLGTPATFGDDRSLTNFILRTHQVVYHAAARCATYVPRQWAVFFRQQLRWKKSWFRETTIASRFMYKKHPAAVLAYYGSVIITVVSPLIGMRALMVLPLTDGGWTLLPYILGVLMVYALFGLIYHFYTQESHWYYGMAFALLYVVFLSFQNYYALATAKRNHWGTR